VLGFLEFAAIAWRSSESWIGTSKYDSYALLN
jgi:hypothetical protein